MISKAWDWLQDIDWKKWAGIALEVAPFIMQEENAPATIIPIDVNVNLFSNIPLDYSLADPEP